ncbi:MAG: hypothetical protein ACR2K5_12770 [Pseudolabrys sp.]
MGKLRAADQPENRRRRAEPLQEWRHRDGQRRGTTTATYTAASNDTLQTFTNAINNTAGIKVTASLNSSARSSLTARRASR